MNLLMMSLNKLKNFKLRKIKILYLGSINIFLCANFIPLILVKLIPMTPFWFNIVYILSLGFGFMVGWIFNIICEDKGF
jgi:hypothetical protein